MKTSSVLLLAGALVLAATSALVARALMRPPPPVTIVKEVQVEPPASQQILTAAHALVPGEFIDGSALKWRDVPVEEVVAGDMVANRDNEFLVYGATVRRPVEEGQSLRSDMLLRPGDAGFLAAVLQPGKRAISVPTNDVASNAGLVAAGDRVDIILSLNRDGALMEQQPNQPPLLAAQTILRDIRVLALGDRVQALAPPISQEEEVNSSRNQRQYFDTITLEVDSRDAEKLAVAKELGTLHVALRRVGDEDPAFTASEVTRLADTTNIFPPAVLTASTKPPASVTTYKGKEARRVVFGPAAAEER